MQWLLLATLGCSVLLALGDPDRCCYPPQGHYTSTIYSGSHSAAGDGITEGTQVTDYDVALQKASSILEINYTGGKMKTQTIVDFKNKVSYTIDMLKNTCTKMASNQPMLYCIPNNATYLESGVMGALDEIVKYNTWNLPIKLPGGGVENSIITVSEIRCSPIAGGAAGDTNGVSFFTASKFLNVTDSADQNAFRIPAICSSPVPSLSEPASRAARVTRGALRMFGYM